MHVCYFAVCCHFAQAPRPSKWQEQSTVAGKCALKQIKA
jgi:hypothetical protein